MRERLLKESYPRSIALLILSVSGGCAFLFSAISLSAGFESMTLRYLVATLVGYVAFVLLIRAWIAYRRGHRDLGLDNLLDLDLPRNNKAPEMFRGGRSGGGGGGDSWQAARDAASSHDLLPSTSSWIEDPVEATGAIDMDELWWIVVAALLAVAGLAAVFYVVYVAPLLLAEVALDAALVATLYRRMRRAEAGHWVGAVFRHTWAPLVALTAFVTLLGFFLQTIVPDAHSIGDVLRTLRS